jgi:hypothetical protein
LPAALITLMKRPAPDESSAPMTDAAPEAITCTNLEII